MKLGAGFVHQCSVGVARLRGCLRMEWNFPIRAGHREAAGRAQEVRLVVLKWFTVVSRWAELMNCGGAQGDGLRIVELAQGREKEGGVVLVDWVESRWTRGGANRAEVPSENRCMS